MGKVPHLGITPDGLETSNMHMPTPCSCPHLHLSHTLTITCLPHTFVHGCIHPCMPVPLSIIHLSLAPVCPCLHMPTPCLCPCLCLALSLIHHAPPPCLHPWLCMAVPLSMPSLALPCLCPHPHCSMLTITSSMHLTHPLVLSHHCPTQLQSPSVTIF